MEGTLPVWDTITASWEKTKGAKGTIWAAIGIMFAISVGFGILNAIMPGLKFVFNIISRVINMLLQAGAVYIGIQRAKNAPIEYTQVFRAFDWQLGLNVIFLFILKFLILLPFIAIMAGGFLLVVYQPIIGWLIVALMICGVIYVTARLSMGIGLVIDKEIGAVNAIKASYKATDDQVWSLIGIYLLMACFIIISAIPLGIGLIWTLPLGVIVYGSVYQKLIGKQQQ